MEKFLVVVLMGSKSDFPNAKKVGDLVEEFGVDVAYRVASAHRAPKKVLEIVSEYNALAEEGTKIVFVVVVGLSNALSGMLACATPLPIVTCPVTEEDVDSSLRMPFGVSHAVILKPENAALFALKILGLSDGRSLKKKLVERIEETSKRNNEADEEVKRS